MTLFIVAIHLCMYTHCVLVFPIPDGDGDGGVCMYVCAAGGGVCIGNKIAPIFYNTMEDSGALPLEMSVDKFSTGDVIDIFPYEVRTLQGLGC